MKIERIFRASEHQFKASAFHKKCDNIEDTLTLIRTDFGKTIGGFNHYPWKSTGGPLFDSGKKAFIFSLDMKEKFVSQDGRALIFRDYFCGPIFGCTEGDIFI